MIGVKGYIKRAICNYNNVYNNKPNVNYYYNEILFDEISKDVGDCILNACKSYFVSKNIEFGDTNKNKNIREEMIDYVLENSELGKFISKVHYYQRSWIYYTTCDNRSITDKQFAVRYFTDMVDAMKKLCDYLVDIVGDMRGEEHVEFRKLYK